MRTEKKLTVNVSVVEGETCSPYRVYVTVTTKVVRTPSGRYGRGHVVAVTPSRDGWGDREWDQMCAACRQLSVTAPSNRGHADFVDATLQVVRTNILLTVNDMIDGSAVVDVEVEG